MMMETVNKIQQIKSGDGYFNLDKGERPCTSLRKSFFGPVAYVAFGLLLGYIFATVNQPSWGPAVPQFRWLKTPLKWWRPESKATQLYDASQADKFINLRERIDEEFNSQVNAVDNPSVVQYDPFRFSMELLDRIDEEFEKFFQELAKDAPADVEVPWVPAQFDVEDTESQMVVTLKMPELDPENVKIDLKAQRLLVSVTEAYSNDTAQYQSSFARVFVVPEGVTSKDVAATFEEGQLKIVVNKPRAVEPMPETIVIQNDEQ